MTSSRRTSVPIDHLIAEVAAFPLASEAALKLQYQARLDHTNPQCIELHPRLQALTAPLWRAAENHLVVSYPGFSLEELITMRDRIWFNSHLQFRTDQLITVARCGIAR